MYIRQSLVIIPSAIALTVIGPSLSVQGANGHTITKHGLFVSPLQQHANGHTNIKHGDPSGVNGKDGINVKGSWATGGPGGLFSRK